MVSLSCLSTVTSSTIPQDSPIKKQGALTKDKFEDRKEENDNNNLANVEPDFMCSVKTENSFDVLSEHHGHATGDHLPVEHGHEPEPIESSLAAKPEVSSTDSVKKSKPWKEPWTCELCGKTFPWGYTFEQVYHIRDHEMEVKKYLLIYHIQ